MVLVSGNEVRDLGALHGGPVKGLAWLSDQCCLVSGSLDSTIAITRIADCNAIADFTLDSAAGALAVAGDGTIIAGDGLGSLHFLELLGYSSG